MNIEIYQENAADWLAQQKIGMVVSPAGSGKTIIAALALSKWFENPENENKNVGWVCNTQEQKQQAHAALNLFNIAAHVECAAAQSDWSGCDVLVVDECHHAIAPEWMKQIQTCKGVRWGLTATPATGDDDRDNELQKFFCHNVYTVERGEVKNRVASAKVVMLDNTDADIAGMIDEQAEKTFPRRRAQMQWIGKKSGYVPDDREIMGQVKWQACVEIGIVGNALRNEKAIRLAQEHSADQVLMLVNQVEHAQWLADQIGGASACFSKMGAKARRAALESFRSGSTRCLVATSLADEGLDLPNANVLILVSGGRSNAKTEQRTGRVLRTFAGKSHGLIYDFHDRQHPLMAKHSRIRQELYCQLGYEITS